MTFAAGTMTMKGVSKDGGEKQKTAKYTLDTTKTPHWIDIDAQDGDKKEKVLGLYDIKGDTLRFAMGRPNGDRPTSLESKEGDKFGIAELRRVK